MVVATKKASKNSKPSNGKPKPKRLPSHISVQCIPLRVGNCVLQPEKWGTASPSLDVFCKEYLHTQDVDLEPPYQRQSVWSVRKSMDWVAALFNKTPLAAIYLVRKSKKSDKFWCMDGRQRCTALIQFFRNEFGVYVELSDGRTIKAFWSQISTDPAFSFYKKELLNRKVELIVAEPMPMESQRLWFIALNSGESLNSAEKIYCHTFLARKVLDEAFSVVFAKLAQLMPPGVREGRRFANIRVVNEALMLCYGPQFNQKAEGRALRNADLKDSAESLHDILSLDKFDYEDSVNVALLTKLSLKDKLEKLRHYADELFKVFQVEPNLGRVGDAQSRTVKDYIHPRNIVDPLAFLVSLDQSGQYKLSYMERDRPKLVKWLKDYYTKKAEKDYDMSTSDLDTMRAKFTLMGETFGTHVLVG